MSRFTDGDDEEFPGQFDLYQANLRRALKGKRGQKFLRELREALMALPEPKLIEGAMCTVGAADRRAALVSAAEAEYAESVAYANERRAPGQPLCYEPRPDLSAVEDFDRHVRRDGEGVCAGGAYIWYQRVKGGTDPGEAFASLPLLLGVVDEDGEACDQSTADMLAEAGRVAHCVAWEVASANDESFARMDPEGRHEMFLRWIDRQLADEAVTAGA